MPVASFAEIQDEFDAFVKKVVWCAFVTVDRAGRPRSRILHPIWEGSTGWVATGRQSYKARHLTANPFVSLTYWDPAMKQLYAECRAEWEDSLAEKRRIWNLYTTTPPPLGYDPGMIWKGGPDDPGFGLLKLTPWRIELAGYELPAVTYISKVWEPGKEG